jgi:predicted XRE-type DNA-binding protein
MTAERDAEATDVQFKLALMRAVDTSLRGRYRTLSQAAEHTGVNFNILSRLRNGRHEYFSVKWLFRFAATANVHIRISVDPVN